MHCIVIYSVNKVCVEKKIIIIISIIGIIIIITTNY